MARKLSNDELILLKEKEINILLENIKKAKKGFVPLTNLSLEWNNQRYNLNVLPKETLLYLSWQLSSFNDFLKDNRDLFKISGFSLSDWISDLENQFKKLNLRHEEERLSNLQNKLKDLLTKDKKDEILITDLINQI